MKTVFVPGPGLRKNETLQRLQILSQADGNLPPGRKLAAVT